MAELPITSFQIYPGWGIKDKSGRHWKTQTPKWESILWVQFEVWNNSPWIVGQDCPRDPQTIQAVALILVAH